MQTYNRMRDGSVVFGDRLDISPTLISVLPPVIYIAAVSGKEGGHHL